MKPIALQLPTSSTYQGYMKRRPAAAPALKSFLIVRHPFARLVSAYRDKLEHLNGAPVKEKNFYYTRYGKVIVAKYRSEAIKRFGANFFNEANNFGSPVNVTRGRRTADLPTFWEFVQFVKSSTVSRMDEHWCPVYRLTVKNRRDKLQLQPVPKMFHIMSLQSKDKLKLTF
jgi:hypothetical protein